MWLIRMARWARNPPSMKRVLLWFGMIAACLLLAGVEWLWGWPDWLTINKPAKVPRL